MTCPYQFHGITRTENGDGTVTLELRGWRYTTSAERDPGPVNTCQWCRRSLRRVNGLWEGPVPGTCPDAGPDGLHYPHQMPQAVSAAAPCMTRTVPARFCYWKGRGDVQFIESEDAAAMVADHVGGPYTVVWQGKGWTVEVQSGYPLWQMTG